MLQSTGATSPCYQNGLVNVCPMVSQQFTVQPGDTISGWAFFDTSDYLPYTDNGYVRITDANDNIVATPFAASIASVGSYGETPWTPWQFTFTTGGAYKIAAGVDNGIDSTVASYIGLDAVQLVHGQPQFFAGPSKAAVDTPALTRQLQPVVTQALAQLATVGYNVSGLGQVQFHVAALPDSSSG